MDYKHFTVENFLADAYFRKWVFDPDQETQKFWSQWLQENQDKRGEVEEAKQIISSIRFNYYKASQVDFEGVWTEINTKRNKPPVSVHAHRKEKSRSMNMLWLKVAASISIMAILFYLISYSEKYETYNAAYGETKTIVLPDKTEVVMNANSELKFNKRWKENQKREVWLEGEAFFHVNKVIGEDKKSILFFVHTGELDVEVLGTQFNVHARRGETKVVLNSGKVKLNLDKQKKEEIYMEPGEMVAVSQNNRDIIRKQVHPEEHAAWREHWLVFDGSTLAEVKEILEDYYGFEVIIEEENLATRKFKGRFPSDRVNLALQALEASLDIRVRRDHNRIFIQSK